MRLNFASQPAEDIEEGMKRLGGVIRQMKVRK
jgi:DNA-binding transcriptional MocR family regulator